MTFQRIGAYVNGHAIPLGVILTLLVQAAIVVWYASALNSQVEANAQHIAKVDSTQTVIRQRVNEVENTQARFMERSSRMFDSVDRLDSNVQALRRNQLTIINRLEPNEKVPLPPPPKRELEPLGAGKDRAPPPSDRR